VNGEWQVVNIGEVPTAPVQKRGTKYARIVTALQGLKPDEAIRVHVGGMKELSMFRAEVRRVAKRSTSRRVLTSREKDGKYIWLWLEPIADRGPARAVNRAQVGQRSYPEITGYERANAF
jgi:hypothetical protein